MPYPSTPLTGPQTYTSLSPLLRQPNHRNLASPPISCFRERSYRSPLLSPRHHIISISSGLESPGDYFTTSYEGTTRTPECTPQAEEATRDVAMSSHDFATGLAARAAGVNLASLDSMLQLSPKLSNRRKGPGLRISDMPTVILQSMIRGDSDESTDSDGTLKMDSQAPAVLNYQMNVEDGVGLGLLMGEGTYGEERNGKKRVPTPYPSERETWIEDADMENLSSA